MKLKLTVLTVAVAALGFSAAVFAAPPTGKGKPATTPASTNAAHPTVMVVVHGTIASPGYTAANGSTNGSVVITVTSANHFAKDMKSQSQPMTFVISSSTKVVGTPTVGHKATLKWRATKAPTTSAPAGAVFQLIDQGSAS